MECISLTSVIQTEALRGIGIYRWQGEKKKRIHSFHGAVFLSASFSSQPRRLTSMKSTSKQGQVHFSSTLGTSEEQPSHGEKVWFPFQTVAHRRQWRGQNMSDHSLCWGQFQLHVHFHHRYVVSVKCFTTVQQCLHHSDWLRVKTMFAEGWQFTPLLGAHHCTNWFLNFLPELVRISGIFFIFFSVFFLSCWMCLFHPHPPISFLTWL